MTKVISWKKAQRFTNFKLYKRTTKPGSPGFVMKNKQKKKKTKLISENGTPNKKRELN